jgi:hypothetical protein
VSVLLDTDIAIEILRARDQDILSKWSGHIVSGTAIFYSPMTVAEVWAGARPKEYETISRFFRPLICVPTEYKIGQLAGEYIRQYGKSHSLDIADAIIAATTVQLQATLWTRNRKHYPMPDVVFFQ